MKNKDYNSPDFIADVLKPAALCGYYAANIIKYVKRHKTIDGLEDLKKAFHYAAKLAEVNANVIVPIWNQNTKTAFKKAMEGTNETDMEYKIIENLLESKYTEVTRMLLGTMLDYNVDNK